MATRTKNVTNKQTAEPKQNIGKVVQVIGPVLDVEFEPERLPELYNALLIDHAGNGAAAIRLVAEVQQHIGRNQVRAVAMSSTDGVVRGMDVVDTGQPITVPVGKAALGRILNVLGEPVDERSEEHTSELQSLAYLVCRLLLEKKKKRLKNTARLGRQVSVRWNAWCESSASYALRSITTRTCWTRACTAATALWLADMSSLWSA